MENRPDNTVSLIIFAVSLLFGMASVGVMANAGFVILAIVVLPIFTASLSYLFTRIQKPWTVLSPLVTVLFGLAMGLDPALTVITVSLATLAASTYALMTLRKADTFPVLLVQIIFYAIYWGGLLCALLISAFGSLRDGFEAIGTIASDAFELTLSLSGMSETIDMTEKGYISEVMKGIYLLLPTVVGYLAIISAWIGKGVLRLICTLTNETSLFFYAPARPPRGFAWIFVLATFLSFMSEGYGEYAVVLSNLSNTLTLLFAYEGVREYISALKRKPRSRVMLIVLGVYAVVMATTMLIPILSYYGAFCLIFGRRNRQAPVPG